MTVPPETLQLLRDRIDSFEKLELVVALHEAKGSRATIEQLCKQLGLARDVINDAVFALRQVALVELTSQGEVELLPPTSQDHAAVSALAKQYREDRFAIATALAEISVDRIRTMASRAFADAFLLRRKPPKG